MPVKAPDLTRLGYRLASMAVYNGTPGGNAVELVYRKADGRDFTLYVRHASDAPRFDQFERAGLRVCIWQDEVLGTVMSGKMSAAEMQRLAALAYSGLES
jgi:anti-sigma factor RsiW